MTASLSTPDHREPRKKPQIFTAASQRAKTWWKKLAPRSRGIGLTAVAVSTALVAQGSVVTDASWNDTEWDTTQLGTLDCANPVGQLASRAEGRVLSGSLLGIDLDNIAEAKGVEATHDGSRSSRAPEAAPSVGEDAYANPLNVEALNLLDIDLTGVLEIPLDTETGVLGQYAQATTAGHAVGAAGTVANDGGIALEQFDGEVPDLATLKLSNVLNSLDLAGLELGTLLQDVTDLELNIGAVAGRAWMDGCRETWGMDDSLTREYLTSHLDLELTSDLVGTVGTTLSATVDTVENTANGLIGNDSLLAGVLGDVVDVVAGSLNIITGLVGLRIGSDDGLATIEALQLDTTAVRALLDEPFGDDVVEVDLTEGTLTVNTVALLSAAYPGEYDQGLNGLAPNTNPLQDEHVLNVLLERVGQSLQTFIADIQNSLIDTVLATETTVQLAVPLQRCSAGLALTCNTGLGSWVDLGGLGITISGSISELLGGEADINVDTSILTSLLGLIGSLVGTLVNSIVGGLTTTVVPNIGGLLENALSEVTTLPPTLFEDVAAPVVNLVGGLYDSLFLAEIVAITVNSQNDPAVGSAGPRDWESLVGGRYDVAALRVGVLDGLGDAGVAVYLGRGSVGPVCSPAQFSETCASY